MKRLAMLFVLFMPMTYARSQHFWYGTASFTGDEPGKAGWVVKLSTDTYEAMSDDIFLQKSRVGGGSPVLRGFGANRVLMVLDGVRMNNAIYTAGNLQNVISPDPSIIELTEVIFGPGAPMYGSDALGGVLDFHTKRALFSSGDSIYYKAEELARYATASGERTFHLDFNAGSKKAAFLTSFSWSDFGHLMMGSWKYPEYLRNIYQARTAAGDTVIMNSEPRRQVATGYSRLNLTNKLRLKAGKHLDLEIANHYSRLSEVPRYDRLIQMKNSTLKYGDWYYGPQIRMMNSISGSYTKPSVLSDEAKLVIARQDYRESRHVRNLDNVYLNENTEKVGIWSVNLDFRKTPAGKKSMICYGSEYVRNNIRSTADTRNIMTDVTLPAGSRYPDGKNIFNSIAFYGDYSYNISFVFSVSAGARYTFVSLNSEIADNSFYNFPFTTISTRNSAVTGALGAVCRPDVRTELSLNLSTGFRAPNLDDIGKISGSAPDIMIVPNPDLKPEYLYSIDAGVSRELGDFLVAEATGFFSYLDNAMVRRRFLFNGEPVIMYQGEESAVYAMVNADYAVIYGARLKAELKPSGYLSIRSALTITAGHDDAKNHLRHVPPLFGSTHIIFERSYIRADLYSVYNGSITYDRLAPAERDKAYMYATDNDGNPFSPGWLTLNFKSSFNLSDRLDRTAGVENILDLRYRPYSSAITAPGRNFIFSVRIKV
jgi:hemoglobin/transferrin/lactoferrin receptor protein